MCSMWFILCWHLQAVPLVTVLYNGNLLTCLYRHIPCDLICIHGRGSSISSSRNQLQFPVFAAYVPAKSIVHCVDIRILAEGPFNYYVTPPGEGVSQGVTVCDRGEGRSGSALRNAHQKITGVPLVLKFLKF